MSGALPAVLIVDDDADARALLESFARAEGFAPLLAADGVEALRMFAVRHPDIILLDAVMPEMDGFETCRRIKAIDGAEHVPVIFMTGLTETEHVVQGLSAGGVDYVTKPLVLDELAARVRVHLGNAKAARSAMTLLDTVGARLLTADATGAIGWATPEARRLTGGLDGETSASLAAVLARLAAKAESEEPFEAGALRLTVTLLGAGGPGEFLFKLSPSIEGMENGLLRDAFGVTPREADVLLWTARGKSNKDMSEILNISARTVNKHLEQIFIKIGVENRASATAAATRVLLRER
ncbi:MAG: DNA-binding response regulator [Novosphingobium sp.]